jgi:hypothetical protein
VWASLARISSRNNETLLFAFPLVFTRAPGRQATGRKAGQMKAGWRCRERCKSAVAATGGGERRNGVDADTGRNGDDGWKAKQSRAEQSRQRRRRAMRCRELTKGCQPTDSSARPPARPALICSHPLASSVTGCAYWPCCNSPAVRVASYSCAGT